MKLMRLFEVPEGLQIFGVTDFDCQTIVATDHGVFIVTEDNVWLKVKPIPNYFYGVSELNYGGS